MRRRGGRRERGPRSLSARLLLWFLLAIALAALASVATTWLTSSDTASDSPQRVVSRHVQQRVARSWDDPVATDAYVAELRDTTGLDIRVRRDATMFPSGRGRPGGMVFEDGIAYFPVVRHGQTVGALELRTGVPAPQAWRVVVALLVALLVLGLTAHRVSRRLARPLEHVAQVAERFGSGELAARTGVDEFPRRWVAKEVRDVGRAFDAMAERISRVVLDQRELLAAISHELRSPLGRARVALEIARERSEAAPSAARSMDDVERQLESIDAILGDLLASARAGLADLHRERRDIGRWLEEKIEGETAGPVELVRDRSAPAPVVEFDAALLGRAFHNVLANAWAHGHPKDHPLVVTLDATKDGVRISVRDRGPGFASDVLPRAFEPFVTGTGKARSPGAHGIGLGLSLVRRIVEAHGGRVSAENVEADGADRAAGAIVRFEIPREPIVVRAADGPDACGLTEGAAERASG